MAKIVKTRNWGILVYPDSAPPDWKEKLQATGLRVAISPLHDKDVEKDAKTGVEKRKKPHHHIILVFPNTTTKSAAEGISKSLNGPTYVERIASVEGTYQYFTHENNPEKAQYSKDDIICLNGFDIRDWHQLSKSETLEIVQKLMFDIIEYDIEDFATFMDHVMSNCPPIMQEVACGRVYFFTQYITGKWQRQQKEQAKRESAKRKEKGK